MKYFLCLALSALPALGQPVAVAPLALFTLFQPQPSPVMVASIRREVGDIMAPLGFPFEWWSIDGAQINQEAAELAVITFRGNCSSANLLIATTTPGPLGLTHISNGEVLPFADVDCDRIRDFLRKDLLRVSANEREHLLGRAVGRVLAHELFHVFVGTTHHGTSGVAEPAFTERELMSDRFRLESREFRILRASLKQARRRNSLLRSAASPVAGRFIFQESGCSACHGPVGEGTPSAPALRGSLADVNGFAARLARDMKKMSSLAKSAWRGATALDEDEIADVMSFLNKSN
jgi:hypothetical protein